LIFKKTADDTNDAKGNEKVKIFAADNKTEFFGALGELPSSDKIKRIVFIGHGRARGLAFSGKPTFRINMQSIVFFHIPVQVA
jgi:hypothetical protein